MYSLLCAAITDAAKTVGMLVTPSSSKPASAGQSLLEKKAWFDNECRVLRKAYRSANRISARCNHSPTKAEIRHQCKKQYTKCTRNKEAEYIQSMKNCFSNVKCPAEFWKAVKFFTARPACSSSVALDIWNKFYARTYPPRPVLPLNTYTQHDVTLDGEFTPAELVGTLSKLKANKAPGSDGLSNEFYSFLPPNWITFLLDLFNKVLHSEIFPHQWTNIILTMLHKKGDRNDPSNYRGIALVNTITKIFTSMMSARPEKWADREKILPECQLGFRRRRSYSDCIFILNAAIHLQLRHNKNSTYALFVDFQRAFDSIPHDKLWSFLDSIGVSGKFIRILRSLYDRASIRVRSIGAYSESFDVTEGVLQGESLSPLLFLLYISDFENFFREEGLYGVNIDNLTDVLLLLYADDTVILARHQVDLHYKLKALRKYCDSKGLKVNITKTKILIFQRAGKTKAIKDHFMKYNGSNLEIVRSYVYLGVNMSRSALGLQATISSIGKARAASGAVISLLLRAKCSSLKVCSTLFNSMVASTLLYAFPTWGLLYLGKLEQVQVGFYKRFLGLPNSTPGYAVRTELGLSPLKITALAQTWNWFVKVLRLPANSLAKICLLRLFQLSSDSTDPDPFNWVSVFKHWILETSAADLWGCWDPDTWEQRGPMLFEDLKALEMEIDVRRYQNSSVLLAKFPRSAEDGLPAYMWSNSHLAMKRILSGLRLATNFFWSLRYNGKIYKFYPKTPCPHCNLSAAATVEHFLLKCPVHEVPRVTLMKSLNGHVRDQADQNFLLSILNSNNFYVHSDIFKFCAESLRQLDDCLADVDQSC